MDNKDEKENPADELDKALLDQFNQTPLNLTNEDKTEEPDDPEFAAKLQGEYEKFMNQMKNGALEGEEGMEGLADALGGLLKGLTESLGMEGKEGEDFKNLLEGKAGEQSKMQDLASKLLEVFMKKQLLYEPLQQSKANYEEYFKKEAGKIAAEDRVRFEQQYATIKQILRVLQVQPENKQKLMQLFEKMQDYGQPPAGIVSVSLPAGI